MKNPQRRYDLDWLRVLAVVLLIYFHTAAIFYQGDLGQFYVTNSEISPAIGIFILFVHQWHMPLFFFLSGAATWFSLEARTAAQYVKERFQRLLIPFLWGTLMLVPLQVYYRHLQSSGDRASYLQFYPQFFNGIRPTGNFEWAHLWFVIYLLVFSLVALPSFLWLKQVAQQNWYIKLSLDLERLGSIFYLALPLALIEALFRPKWIGFQNLYDDWANVLLYLTYFVYGYVFESERRLWQIVDRQRSFIFGAAIIGISILLGLWIMGKVPERSYSPSYMIYQAFRGFNGWCWVVALLSLGRSHLNFNHWLLQYASKASYPFYLVHQPIIVAIGFYIVKWQTGIPQKFIIISTTALVLSLGLYELIIRRFNVVRFCFGLKPSAASLKVGN
ncbi:MAG: acyltransferase family protein [Timaviella obliquedivisa GSE-PSE-MK23-08B]|nr:acyltransferase family protein [Timaviella obliquedivisa GSE-PSE-MK23-08B]